MTISKKPKGRYIKKIRNWRIYKTKKRYTAYNPIGARKIKNLKKKSLNKF